MTVALALCVQGTTFAQATSKPLEFEVASVRQVAAAPGTTGAGLVAITPDRASYRGITLKSLLMHAYDLEWFQISGPAWIESERYDVLATIPEGATKEDVPVMLQQLLAERFRLTLHSETMGHQGYVLRIGKGGPKLQLSTGPQKSDTPADPSASRRVDWIRRQTRGDGSVVETLHGATMLAFATHLSDELQVPVIDSTGLSGKFDIILRGSTGADGSSANSDSWTASLFTAVRDLGLELDSEKVPVKRLVIDKAEKIPTEN